MDTVYEKVLNRCVMRPLSKALHQDVDAPTDLARVVLFGKVSQPTKATTD